MATLTSKLKLITNIGANYLKVRLTIGGTISTPANGFHEKLVEFEMQSLHELWIKVLYFRTN